MSVVAFDKLLLQTMFCCMAADGDIDDREIDLIKSISEKSPILSKLNLQEELNLLVQQINAKGKAFIMDYFDLLSKAQLTPDEELTLIDYAIQIINADEKVEYAEVKFFKNIRHRLKISDEKILERFPDIELYLEPDIVTDDYLDKIARQYFEAVTLPQFDVNALLNKLKSGNESEETS